MSQYPGQQKNASSMVASQAAPGADASPKERIRDAAIAAITDKSTDPDKSAIAAPPCEAAHDQQNADTPTGPEAQAGEAEMPHGRQSLEADPFASLKDKQKHALERLAEGFGVHEVAGMVGVARSTVYRWLTQDANVRAAYNRWKLASAESARARLVAVQDIAAQVVAERIENDRDHHLAARVLERMGVLSPAPVSAADSARAAREIELERRQKNVELGRRSEKIEDDGRYIGSAHRFEEPK